MRPDGSIIRSNPAFGQLVSATGRAREPVSLFSLFTTQDGDQLRTRIAALDSGRTRDSFICFPTHASAGDVAPADPAAAERVDIIGGEPEESDAREPSEDDPGPSAERTAAEAALDVSGDGAVPEAEFTAMTAWRFDISVAGAQGNTPILLANIHDVTADHATRERLKRAKDAAERATRTKSAFLANMSHEIRTPIHTITGMTELLLDTEQDEEQLEYTNQVRFSAEVLLSLINDILDFSKIEAGKLTLEVIDFDASEVTEDAVDLVSLEAHKKGIEIVVDIGPGIPRRVSGDPARLRQIIVNLFNNAVKFTPEGQVVIRVRATSVDGDRANVLFEVIDSGVGIPRDKVGQLFRAFSQVDSSTTRRYGGSGLGLSICKSLVTMMGGKIGVRSEEGRGSTFWFTIPFLIHDDAVRDEPLCAGRRILLVDDNDAARMAVQGYLERWQGDVDAVSAGEDALRLLRQAVAENRPYDIVLVDLILPRMDGWHLASEINADKEINATALILMSPAGKMGGEAKMKRLMWFNGYVNKPVRRYELAGAMRSIFTSDLELASPEDDDAKSPADSQQQPIASHRLLVAEDHYVNQQLFQTILEKLGHHVLLASNGREAVEKARELEPALIFMDVQMPEMNGYEATTRLRLDGFSQPIIAVTANALRGERDKCLEVGMNDYLTKPFKRDDLLPLLAKWLPATGVRAGAQLPSDDEPAELEELKDASDLEPLEELDEATMDQMMEMQPELVDYTVPDEMVSGVLSGPDAPVFDVEAAVTTFVGRRDVVERVVRDFVAKIEAILPVIRQSIETEEFDTVCREAHGLKGGAWNLEARRFGDMAALLEASGKMADVNRCRYYLERLESVYEEFRTEVSALFESEPAGRTTGA